MEQEEPLSIVFLLETKPESHEVLSFYPVTWKGELNTLEVRNVDELDNDGDERVEGVVIEAMTNGIPVVVTEGTTLQLRQNCMVQQFYARMEMWEFFGECDSTGRKKFNGSENGSTAAKAISSY